MQISRTALRITLWAVGVLALSSCRGGERLASTDGAVSEAPQVTPERSMLRLPTGADVLPDTRALMAACVVGVWSACDEVGGRYETATPPRWALANRFWRHACEGGHGPSCWRLGSVYAEGQGVSIDLGEACRFQREACDQSFPSGCAEYGVMLLKGAGCGPDARGAFLASQRACALGDGVGCKNLGVLYREGRGTPVDVAEAFLALKKSCVAKHGDGCTQLGIMQYTGNGRPVDLPGARGHFEQACTLGSARGCGNAGGMYLRGVGVAEHAGKALAYSRRGCSGDDAVACYNLGLIHRYRADGKRDEEEAKKAFEIACRGAHRQGCDEYRKGAAQAAP